MLCEPRADDDAFVDLSSGLIDPWINFLAVASEISSGKLSPFIIFDTCSFLSMLLETSVPGAEKQVIP